MTQDSMGHKLQYNAAVHTKYGCHKLIGAYRNTKEKCCVCEEYNALETNWNSYQEAQSGYIRPEHPGTKDDSHF